MRFLTLIALLLIQPCFARAEWPFSDTKEVTWPLVERSCDCDPCTCPPATCHCPGCKTHAGSGLGLLLAANTVGCKNKSGAASAVNDATYSVGMMDVQPQFMPMTTQAPVQYQQVCVNGVCQLVPVQTAQAKPALTAGSLCPCCGMVMTAEQAAKASAPAQAVQAAPYAMAPMTYTYGAGSCASCATAGVGSYGAVMVDSSGSSSGRQGIFARWRSRRANRGSGGCGG